MGFIKFLFKKCRGYSVIMLIIALVLTSSGYITFLPNVAMALIFSVLVLPALLMGFFLLPYHAYKFEKILDEYGCCDELIRAFNLVYKKKGAREHLILASYYRPMGRLGEMQQELDLAQSCGIPNLNDKAVYFNLLMALRLMQRRFGDAQVIYYENKQLLEVYCDSYKDSICCGLYSKLALFCAFDGNFDDAMTAIGKMDVCIEKQKSLVFAKYIAEYRVYLVKGDLQSADEVRQRMLGELETFSGFDYRSERKMFSDDLSLFTVLFDPRAQTQQREGNVNE